MKHFKRILISLAFILLFLPSINENNVYAKTVSFEWDSAPAARDSGQKTSTIYDMDFSLMDSASVTYTTAEDPKGLALPANITFYAYDTAGNLIDSKSYSGKTIARTGKLTIDLTKVSCKGYFECIYSGYYQFKWADYGDASQRNTVSISNVTAICPDKASFGSITANGKSALSSSGNLTRPCAYIVFV